MGFRVGAVDEYPFEIRLLDQRPENAWPFPGSRPGIETLVDRVPDAESAGQIPPRATDAHSVEHALNGQAQIGLVVDGLLEENFFQLRPELVTEHQSGHCKLAGSSV
ncbi:hypothetical protein D3C71_1922600 [compost metagenome]